MNKYQLNKGIARDKAIEYQHEIMANDDLSYCEISILCNKFYRLAKQYGLIREFRENGII